MKTTYKLYTLTNDQDEVIAQIRANDYTEAMNVAEASYIDINAICGFYSETFIKD